MQIAVTRERADGERRVAVIPDSVARLVKKGHSIEVEAGAGLGSGHADDDYRAAGPKVAEQPSGQVYVQIGRAEPASLPEGATVLSLLWPLFDAPRVAALASRRITAIAVDMIPRTTLAQSMDVLSSQANIAGYWAAVAAAA